MEPDWEAESPPATAFASSQMGGQSSSWVKVSASPDRGIDPADMGSTGCHVPTGRGTLMARRALLSLVTLGLVVGLAVPAQAATESKVTG
jgi:hypothetical protein